MNQDQFDFIKGSIELYFRNVTFDNYKEKFEKVYNFHLDQYIRNGAENLTNLERLFPHHIRKEKEIKVHRNDKTYIDLELKIWIGIYDAILENHIRYDQVRKGCDGLVNSWIEFLNSKKQEIKILEKILSDSKQVSIEKKIKNALKYEFLHYSIREESKIKHSLYIAEKYYLIITDEDNTFIKNLEDKCHNYELEREYFLRVLILIIIGRINKPQYDIITGKEAYVEFLRISNIAWVNIVKQTTGIEIKTKPPRPDKSGDALIDWYEKELKEKEREHLENSVDRNSSALPYVELTFATNLKVEFSKKLKFADDKNYDLTLDQRKRFGIDENSLIETRRFIDFLNEKIDEINSDSSKTKKDQSRIKKLIPVYLTGEMSVEKINKKIDPLISEHYRPLIDRQMHYVRSTEELSKGERIKFLKSVKRNLQKDILKKNFNEEVRFYIENSIKLMEIEIEEIEENLDYGMANIPAHREVSLEKIDEELIDESKNEKNKSQEKQLENQERQQKEEKDQKENRKKKVEGLFREILLAKYVDNSYQRSFINAITSEYVPKNKKIVFKKGERYLIELIEQCKKHKYLTLLEEDIYDFIIRNFIPDISRSHIKNKEYKRKNLQTSRTQVLKSNPITDFFNKLPEPVKMTTPKS